jgi:rubrerythrin
MMQKRRAAEGILFIVRECRLCGERFASSKNGKICPNCIDKKEMHTMEVGA